MMLKPASLLFALLAVAAAPAFAQTSQTSFTVNGKLVPASKFDAILKQATAQGKQQDTPKLREDIKKALVSREVLVQEADKKGLGTKTDVKAAIDNARQSIIIGAMLADYVKKNPVADAELKAEYERIKAAMANEKEYKARHILVPTEDEAKGLITKIKAGSKFEDLAKANSKDGSAADGGLMDWANPGQYVPEFSNAMVALQKGAVTDAPVKSQFGYHVIKLEDTRPAKVPSFDEARKELTERMQQVKLQAFREDLIKKATIK
jgi:peptidyl-prolyl cis-trans isomerase C